MASSIGGRGLCSQPEVFQDLFKVFFSQLPFLVGKPEGSCGRWIDRPWLTARPEPELGGRPLKGKPEKQN